MNRDPTPRGDQSETIERTLFEGGEMGAQTRAFDWAQTPLGPVAQWPQSLKTVIRLMLGSRYAMWLAWGPELTFFCNDAYRPTLGVKQGFIGAPASQVWAEIWSDIGPRIDQVLTRGQATWDEGLLLFLERRGFTEETYHTFSYSPVHNDAGKVEGMLCVVTEDSERTIGERRIATLGAMGTAAQGTRNVAEACDAAIRSLAGNPNDLPFALLYLQADAERLRLSASVGVDARLLAQELPIGSSAWPFAAVLASGEPQCVDDVVARLGGQRAGPWPEPAERALLLPLARRGSDEQLAGFLVAGISPRLSFDAAYERFVTLVAAQVGNAISDARAFEEERTRAEALAELDRAKTAFFSNVSHELRTPLTLMLSPIDEVLGKTHDDEVQHLMALAQRSGKRLQRLVNTLLDFSRIEAGRMPAAFEPLDLSAYTADLASVFRSAVEKAGIAFDIDCAPLAEPVYVDRGMWEKIVFNLLSNAFKFTFKGEIRVGLRAVGSYAELAVADTGSGIPAAAQGRLFERFYRVEGAAGRTIEGSGIGLALVRELARLHGGDARARSEEGRGSTFCVRVPFGSAHLPADQLRAACPAPLPPWLDEAEDWVRDTTSADLGEAATAPPAHDTMTQRDGAAPVLPGPRARPAHATVLIADDNADMRAYLARLFSREHAVLGAADGEEALVLARAHRPDLIISDVMMPRLDGFALLRALRADAATAALPVILLSARAGEEARLEGIEAGADDYLTKPFHARELLARAGGVIALARARGALASSEQRFRELAEAMPQIVYISRADGTIEYVNRQWRDYTGRSAANAEDLPALVHADDLPAMNERWRQSMRNGTPLSAEFRLRRSDGEYRWFLTRSTPVRGADGRILRWYGTSTNIDFQRRHTEVLKRTHEALQRADRRKDEFLATLAHELRNPLAPLRNSVHLLQMSASPETASKVHAMMQRQIDHLVRLVDDLLEVSRIASGKIDLQRAPVELAAVLAGAIEASRPIIDRSRHRLAIDIDSGGLFIDGDAVRLAQVFSNLLNNAAKYTEPGGHIRLSARRDGDEALVSVQDDGIGIAPELLPRVFELFVQAESASSRSQGGLGIGLSLVQSLLALHGASVEARSAGLGHGSEFVVRLPLLLARRAEDAAPAPVSAAPAPAAAPVRVLVCDDNRDAADSLASLLQFLGAGASVFYDGAAALQAVKAAEAERPQLVLLDIGMPAMDGYAVARALRALPGGTQLMLVALTGWGQERDRERTQAAGFDHHLVKPVDLPALQALLATVADARAGHEKQLEGMP